MKRQQICGIYEIVNKENGKRYIGSSKDILRRWSVHKSELKNGIHHNVHLQRAWDTYGCDKFEFNIVTECSLDCRLDAEQDFIDDCDFDNLYNIDPFTIHHHSMWSDKDENGYPLDWDTIDDEFYNNPNLFPNTVSYKGIRLLDN